MPFQQQDLKLRVRPSRLDVALRPGGELLVGGGERGSDVVGEEVRVGGRVVELNDVVVADDATSAGWREFLCRDELPVVIGVFEVEGGDLLTC
jgi:hypothetical protein